MASQAQAETATTGNSANRMFPAYPKQEYPESMNE